MPYRFYWTGTNAITLHCGEPVDPPNTAPVATNASYTVDGQYLEVSAATFMALCSDADGDALSVEVVSDVYGGSLTLDSNGHLVYQRGALTGYVDSFTYRAFDGQAYSNTATITLGVVAIDTPVANPDPGSGQSYSYFTAIAKTVAAPGVLGNDTGTGPLTAVLLTDVSHGTLVLNSNGSFTYTSDAGYTGPDSFTYRAYNGSTYSAAALVSLSVITLPVGIPLSQSTVDEYQATNPLMPYPLSAAGATYTLTENITVNDSAFVVTGVNVTLNLNGKTLTFNNRATLSVPNGGFETGTIGAQPANWDCSAAPHAALAANTTYMWGDKVLQFTNAVDGEYIISDAVSLPVAGLEYSATITVKDLLPDWRHSGTLQIIHASTGVVLASDAIDSAEMERGFSGVAIYRPSAPVSVKLKLILNTTGPLISCVVDNATLSVSREIGIIAYVSDWTYLPPRFWSASWVADGSVLWKSGFTLQGPGTVAQGAGRSLRCSAVYGYESRSLTVDGVTFTVNGDDTDIIPAKYCYNMTVTNNNVTCDINNITNRMHIGTLFEFSLSSGALLVEGNTITDAPRSVIGAGANTGTVIIRNNNIASNTIAGNGYAISVGSIKNFIISGNTIVTTKSSRGIMIGQESVLPGTETSDGEVFDNYVDVRETGSREYGITTSNTGLRVRIWYLDKIQRVNIHDNTFIARAIEGNQRQAIGFRMSLFDQEENDNPRITDPARADYNLRFYDNVYKAIVETTDSYYYGNAISLDDVVNNTGTRFDREILESNDQSLGIGGNDGAWAWGVTFGDCVFRKSSEGVARTYKSVVCGYGGDASGDNYIINPTYEGGATATVVPGGSATKTLYRGWDLDVHVTTVLGVAISGATITVQDRTGATVNTETTDSGGDANVEIVTEILSGTTSFSTDTRTPLTVTVSKSGYTSQVFYYTTMTQRITLTVSLVAS